MGYERPCGSINLTDAPNRETLMDIMILIRLLLALSLSLVLFGCGGSSDTPDEHSTDNPTPTPTPTVDPKPDPTPTPDPALVKIEAEDYDSFSDTTSGNSGGAYRIDDVDIDATADDIDGFIVGWWDVGDWLHYANVVIPATGNYQIRGRVAAATTGGLVSFRFVEGDISLGTMTVPNTSGWDTFETVTINTVMGAGTYTLEVSPVTSSWNLNWIEIVPGGTGIPDSEIEPQILVAPDVLTGALAWSDEFDVIDDTVWSFETGGGGWGNNELQWYSDGDNASIEFDAQADSNVLVIEARQETGGVCWTLVDCEYTSTRINSRFKQSFQYGRIEARIKLPRSQGVWPAFWMLGDNFNTLGWPEGGEIDIMEHVNTNNTTSGALHGPNHFGNTPITGSLNQATNLEDQYHVFAVEWDATGIRWFVDDDNFYTTTPAQVEVFGAYVYDAPFWVLFNVAVGGNWPGDPNHDSFTIQRMYIDYLRVYH
ncbi:MAG: hypothetical protein ACI9Y1_003015 [Lentisphaeria bacterium]|jgi:hypothetical protein